MSTLIVGAGAVGGFFGGRLAEAGKDVTFLVRDRRARELAADGLLIQRPDGVVERIASPSTTAASPDRIFDVIVLTVKAFALDSALDDVESAVGPGTILVPFLNGMRHLDTLAQRFGADHVFGGACYVATELTADGTVVQINDARQLLLYGPISSGGAVHGANVREALSGADFASDLSEDIVQEMWEKWALLASIGAATTLFRSDIGHINRAAGGREATAGIVREITAIAAGSGHAVRAAVLRRIRATMSDSTSPTTSSLYRELLADRRLEAEHIIGDLADRGQALGLDTPLLELARTGLAIHEETRREKVPRAV